MIDTMSIDSLGETGMAIIDDVKHLVGLIEDIDAHASRLVAIVCEHSGPLSAEEADHLRTSLPKLRRDLRHALEVMA